MKRVIMATVAILVLAGAGAAFGQVEYGVRFGDIDIDHSGIVSWEEYKAYYPQASYEAFLEYANRKKGMSIDDWRYYRQKTVYSRPYVGVFSDIDYNRDGLIVWEEFKRYYPSSTYAIFKEAARGGTYIDYDLWLAYRDKYGYVHTEYYGRYREIDLNRDGYVTWDEFYAYYPYGTREQFKESIGQDKSMDYYRWRAWVNRYGRPVPSPQPDRQEFKDSLK